MALDINTPISVTLPAQQWNTVLMWLAEGPYKAVAPLLAEIQRQCMAHDSPEPRAGNGHDIEQLDQPGGIR